MAHAHDRCPADPDEAAEAYCMGTLPATEARTFEDHYIACSRCAAVVENADAYIRSIQQAARELRSAAPRVKAANQR